MEQKTVYYLLACRSKWVSEDSKQKKILKKEILTIFVDNPRIFWLVKKKTFDQNRSKTKFFVENFCRKISPRNLKWKFCWTKNWNKTENYFWIRIRTLRIFWDQKLNVPTFEGEKVWRGGGLHVVLLVLPQFTRIAMS